jgi:hypothetical protein
MWKDSQVFFRSTHVSPVEDSHGRDAHATENACEIRSTHVSPVECSHGRDAHATENACEIRSTHVSPVESFTWAGRPCYGKCM